MVMPSPDRRAPREFGILLGAVMASQAWSPSAPNQATNPLNVLGAGGNAPHPNTQPTWLSTGAFPCKGIPVARNSFAGQRIPN